MAHILIAEDEKPINTLIEKNLTLAGHTCVSVFDGEAVFDELEKQRFDLLLLDIMMPKLDGFAVIAKLREDIPVIFITARGTVHDRVHGLKLGADDYIVKPFDMLELGARIDSVPPQGRQSGLGLHLGRCAGGPIRQTGIPRRNPRGLYAPGVFAHRSADSKPEYRPV